MSETWNKKEREKKKQKERKEKEAKMQERKENAKKGKSLNEMMAYLDEYGNLTSIPQDPKKKAEVRLEDIEIGVPKQKVYSKAELTRSGRVTFFNDAKGFGFIKDTQSQESIFVHVNSVAGPIKENDKVNFEVERGFKGLNAVNVKVVN